MAYYNQSKRSRKYPYQIILSH